MKGLNLLNSCIKNCIIANDVTAGFTSSVLLSDRKYVALNNSFYTGHSVCKLKYIMWARIRENSSTTP